MKKGKQGLLSLQKRSYLEGYILVGPAMILLLAFVFVPIIIGIYISFHRWDGFNEMSFVGLKNYKDILFNDDLFRKSFKNTIIFVIFAVVGKNIIGLILAMLANLKIKGITFFRTSLFIPVTISFVVVGLLWSWIYNPNFGLLAAMFKAVGLESWARPWLGDAKTALWAIIAVDIWKWMGFHMVLFLAGLQTISEELYEAARVDGAHAWQRFRHITLPLIAPITFISVLLSLSGAFVNNFDLVYVMTGGGPNHATEVVMTQMVAEAFRFGKLGYAGAMGFIMFAIVGLCTLVYAKVNSLMGSYEGE